MSLPDSYTRKARLLPALLVVLPLGLATVAWFPDGITGWGTLWGLIVLSGGMVFISQIGRDFGKNKEMQLFKVWGGKPTTRMLRHRDTVNRKTLERRHSRLQELTPDFKIPTLEEERANPKRADELYDACITYLRERTRDRKTFHLIFEENCNYGFRRNLWGMKPLGITMAVVGTLVVMIDIFVNGFSTPPVAIISGTINLLFVTGWCLWITPKWVRIAGDAYAERLLEASEELCKKNDASGVKEQVTT